MPTDLLDPPAAPARPKEPITSDPGAPAESGGGAAGRADAAFFRQVDGVDVPDEVWEQAMVVFVDVGAAADWLRRPLGSFDSQSPLALIEAGEAKEVWATLGRIAWGIPA